MATAGFSLLPGSLAMWTSVLLAVAITDEWSGVSLEAMSINQLSSILHARNSKCDGCTTKEEYIERVRATDATMQQQSAAVPSAGPAAGVLDVRYCMS